MCRFRCKPSAACRSSRPRSVQPARAAGSLAPPLVIDGAAFRPAHRELFPVLRRICQDIKRTPYRDPRNAPSS